MPIPDSVVELIARYENNLDSYRGTHYNEAQVRQEFIDPFFAALGWDMDNTQGFAEAYKDVVHEDAIKIGGVSKAPDYSFRIGGTRKFFLEAKKPAVVLKFEKSAAYQLRRYAWSAKLPLSLLTNFAEFAVYDCRIGPEKDDQPSKARLFYFTYKEYAEKWDEIAGIFSKSAILKGSFDKFAESSKGKRGTAEVDAAFLAQIEAWRDQLARSLALRNPDLSQRDLNFAVQRTIDRIVFLRICEDRGMEPYGQMQALLNGANAYPRLCELFQAADDRYNSGLFHFQADKARPEEPDGLTLKLGIDDKTLKDILRGLYYPDSPYVFSVIPADILGQAYEQFLGKVIRLTPGHRALVEDKPEVKKAGGVYYTPTYIVQYIVQNTLGKLLAGKMPQEAARLRVLDPACGSGSFLIGAFQYLLDWHRDWYVADDPAKHKKELYAGPGGDWRLTSAVRKTILRNSIYGVDIDAQAVEVTKLSLLLKVLEGESAETLNSNLKLFKERALPDLGDNIKCGNSLIGPDFYDLPQAAQLSEDELLRINPFDWSAEFKTIMQGGGFDAVIGNPPWISLSGKFGVDIFTPLEITYLTKHFDGNTYMPNMYEYFVAQGLSLNRKSGLFSFIVPDRLGYNEQFVKLRKRILMETKILAIAYKLPFPNITTDTMVFMLEKDEQNQGHVVNLSEYGKENTTEVQEIFLETPKHTFVYFEGNEIMQLISKILSIPSMKQLKDICKTTSGYGGKSELLYSNQTSPNQIETIKGDSIGRYERRQSYWFEFSKENITGRTTNKQKLGANPKILLRKTGDHIIATYDQSGIFPEQSLYFLFENASKLDFKYLLGLLNSKVMSLYYQAKTLTNKKSIAQSKKVDLDQLPIRTIDFDDPADKAKHDNMVELVEKMLKMHQDLPTKSGQAKTVMERQIAATDAQIDRLVYELYGLTEDEIKIVELGSS